MRRIYSLLLLLSIFFTQSTSAQQLDHVLGDVMVQINKNADIESIVADFQEYQGAETKLKSQSLLSSELSIWLLHFDHAAVNENYLIHELSIHPLVEVAQTNHLISLRETTPNDPNFNQQWHWVNIGGGGGLADSDVDADLAWDLTTGGTTAQGHDIVVCVVEGANRDHPDLQGNLWINTAEIPNNNIDDDDNGYTDDIGGWNASNNSPNITSANHGTAVSGMIGAVGNNGIGITGINWNVKIMHVVVGGLSESNVVAAYNYPLVQRRRFNETNGAEGAFVVATNSSWGIDGGDPDGAPIWCNFYDDLGEEGILSCGATTNQNQNVDVVGDLPTACPSEFMVSVTATNNADVRTFSGYGAINVDLGAPGDNVYTLTTNGYSTTSGTSFATPLTAGVIALLYSAPCSDIGALAIATPAETAIKIRDYIFDGVDQVANLEGEVATGGRINVFNSLQLLLMQCGPCPEPSALSAAEVIDTSAILSWFSTDSLQTLNLQYRLTSDTTWITIPDVSNPYTLNGLLACNEYEYQVEGLCSDTTSGFSNSYIFHTDGCCTAPEGIETANPTVTSIEINWDEVFAAEGYNFRIREVGTMDWTMSMLTTTSYSQGSLELCKLFEFQIETICGPDSTSGYSEPMTIQTDCPCGIPQNVDTISLAMESAIIGWDEIEFADAYDVRMKEFGTLTWAFFESNTEEINLEQLMPCTNYQVQVRAKCPIVSSGFSGTLIFRTACPVAINELESVKDISIFPNPVKDVFQVEFTLPQSETLQIEVYNANGQQLSTSSYQNLGSGTHRLPINSLQAANPGIYFLQLTTAEGSITQKMIKY